MHQLKNFYLQVIVSTCLLFVIACFAACSNSGHSKTAAGAAALPRAGRLVDNKPSGSGWKNLIASLDDWKLETQNWKLDNGILHGDYNGGKLHSYGYTKTLYKDFELNAVFRLTG